MFQNINIYQIPQIIIFCVLVITVYLIQLIIQKILVKIVKNTENLIFDDIAFALSLILRVSSGFIIIFLITVFFDLSIDIILFYSALIGTFISLSSIQIINNLISGLIIVLFIKPYRVFDYIAISGMEGVVSEISLNYTKIKSIDGNYILIPNRSVLKMDITNFTIYKDKEITSAKYNLKRYFDTISANVLTQYSFQMSAPIETMHFHKYALNNVFDEFEPLFGYKPTYFMYSLGLKIDYQILVFGLSSRTIRKSIKQFKIRLIEELHSTNLGTEILKINPGLVEDGV